MESNKGATQRVVLGHWVFLDITYYNYQADGHLLVTIEAIDDWHLTCSNLAVADACWLMLEHRYFSDAWKFGVKLPTSAGPLLLWDWNCGHQCAKASNDHRISSMFSFYGSWLVQVVKITVTFYVSHVRLVSYILVWGLYSELLFSFWGKYYLGHSPCCLLYSGLHEYLSFWCSQAGVAP